LLLENKVSEIINKQGLDVVTLPEFPLAFYG